MKSKRSNLHPFLVMPLRPSVISNNWRNLPDQNQYGWVQLKTSWTEPDLNRSISKRYTKCQSLQGGRTKNSTPNTNEWCRRRWKGIQETSRWSECSNMKIILRKVLKTTDHCWPVYRLEWLQRRWIHWKWWVRCWKSAVIDGYASPTRLSGCFCKTGIS